MNAFYTLNIQVTESLIFLAWLALSGKPVALAITEAFVFDKVISRLFLTEAYLYPVMLNLQNKYVKSCKERRFAFGLIKAVID